MRLFSATRAVLYRKGRPIASLTSVGGNASKTAVEFHGTVVGKPGWWVAKDVACVIAWQVEPRQPNSAWLEADVAITSIDGPSVAVTGSTGVRPHRPATGDAS